MDVIDAKLWAIGVAHQISVTRAEVPTAHGVMPGPATNNSQTAIRRTAHLDPVQGQQLARAMINHARALCAHSIEAVIHQVPGHSCIPRIAEADY
jgi:hypothetical protein